MTEIIEVDEIIEWRKYYFSLSVEKLFQHLLYREVPLLPSQRFEHISVLYEQLDRANDRNSDWNYSRHLVMKTITYIKSSKRHTTPRTRLFAGSRLLNTYEYSVFEFLSGEVIARIYEPHTVDNLRLFFKYNHHESLGDYLLFEARRGTNIKKNHFLCDLADSIHYDNWLLNKVINGGGINVV